MNNIVSSVRSVKVKTECQHCGAKFDDFLDEWVKWMQDMGINVEREPHTRYTIEFYSAARPGQHKE